MNTIDEKRTTARLALDSKICIIDEQQKEIEGTLLNLSATGVLVKTDRPLSTDSNCDLSIIIEGENSNLVINKLAAKVVRCNGDVLALEFSNKMEWLALFYIYKNKFNMDTI